MPRVWRDALVEGTVVFSIFVCFIFKHSEPLLDQHFLVKRGSRGGVRGSGERGKQGWKLMIFPAIKVKIPAWNQTLLEHYAGMGEKGREGENIYYFSRTQVLMRKTDRSTHVRVLAADLKLGLSRFPSTFHTFQKNKNKKMQGRWLGFLKSGGGEATEVPWSYEALNSYIPFIARAGMTSPLISKLSNPAAWVRTVQGTKWNIYMPF